MSLMINDENELIKTRANAYNDNRIESLNSENVLGFFSST